MNLYDATEIAYKNGYEAGKADAIKHGHWETVTLYDDEYLLECSNCYEWCDCNSEYYPSYILHYCPNCGCEMDFAKIELKR